jgi:hypothetical protein
VQEICLIGQLTARKRRKRKDRWKIDGKSLWAGGVGRNVVFIVYNFFEKCLNQSLAAAFRAPNRCGLLSTDFGRREV